MDSWRTLARRTLLRREPWVVVEEHTVELPDGRTINDWPWVVTPDYVNVVLLDEEERFVLFRQTKYSVEGVSLAVVGGYLDSGEEPLAGAKRELREETGYEAETWRSLGSYVIDGNRGVGTGHFFLATAGRPVAEIDADDLEEQQLVLLSRQQVEESLWAGEFKLMPWAAVVALALQHLDRG